jgi:parvulin-like peptidyl-prolyl isomerase
MRPSGLYLSCLLAACSSTPGPSGDPVAVMHASIEALQQRAEQPAEQVEVQHVLIAFQGAPGTSGVKRSPQDAERLAAFVLTRARSGEDFTLLMKRYSDDDGPGIYAMTRATRGQMVQSFGDVSWRLAVGELGVAAHDKQHSPFGWHVIKRLK